MQHKFNIFADIFFTKKKTEETERKKTQTHNGVSLNYLKPTTDLKKKIKPRNSLSSLEKQKKKTLTAKLGPSRFYFS